MMDSLGLVQAGGPEQGRLVTIMKTPFLCRLVHRVGWRGVVGKIRTMSGLAKLTCQSN